MQALIIIIVTIFIISRSSVITGSEISVFLMTLVVHPEGETCGSGNRVRTVQEWSSNAAGETKSCWRAQIHSINAYYRDGQTSEIRVDGEAGTAGSKGWADSTTHQITPVYQISTSYKQIEKILLDIHDMHIITWSLDCADVDSVVIFQLCENTAFIAGNFSIWVCPHLHNLPMLSVIDQWFLLKCSVIVCVGLKVAWWVTCEAWEAAWEAERDGDCFWKSGNLIER